MKILITSGPTNEFIDEVMKITNMSTGHTGLFLCNKLANEGHEITLVATHSVIKSGTFFECKIGQKIEKILPIETTDEMMKIIEECSKKEDYDLIIHSSAVGDYKSDFCFNLDELAQELSELKNHDFSTIYETLKNPKCKIDSSSKISSYKENLTVKLGLTPKIISNLREWFPKAMIFGFKLLDKVEVNELVDVASKLCSKNKLDYVVANDLLNINFGKRDMYIISQNSKTYDEIHSLEELFAFINNSIKSFNK